MMTSTVRASDTEIIEQLWDMVVTGEIVEVAVELRDSDISESRMYPKGTTVTVYSGPKDIVSKIEVDV